MEISSLKRNIAYICLIRCVSSFAASVMFVSLALFLNLSLHITEATAANITGTFLALNYGLPLVAGFIGNHYIKFKTLYISGVLVQAVGYLLLSQVTKGFNLGFTLSLILIGAMVTSVCLIEFISQTVEKHPEHRRTVMLFNYGSMNVGSIFGAIVSGIFSLTSHFALLFIVMSLAPIFCAITSYKFIQYDAKPNKALKHPFLSLLIIFLTVIAAINFIFIFSSHAHDYLLMLTCIGVLIAMIYSWRKSKGNERSNTLAFYFYLGIWIVFWGIFLLTPIMLMYLIKDWVALAWHGIHLQPQWLDIIDPIIIVLFTPVLAYLLKILKSRFKIEIPTYIIFAIAMLIVAGAAFSLTHVMGITPLGSKLPTWIILWYLGVLAIAELLLAPEGHTLPVKLSPQRLRGLLTGVLAASVSIGSLLASLVASHVFRFSHTSTLSQYHSVFSYITLLALACVAVILTFGVFIKTRCASA